MYKEIEYKYKKEGYYNKKIKIISILYNISYIILCFIYLFFKLTIVHIIIATLVYFIILFLVILKLLNIKLSFDVEKIRISINKSREERHCQEITLMKDFLKDNNIYNKEAINTIVEHYRNKSSKKESSNLLTILGIIISIVIATSDKNQIITNLIIYIPLYVTFHFVIIQFINYIKMLKGEEEIYENLESIFSELYIELTSKEDNKRPSKKKQKSKKWI